VVQAFALDRQGGADHGLQRRIAGAHYLAVPQHRQQLESDKAWRHVAPGQLCGGLDEGWAIRPRPEPETKEPGDLGALCVSLAASQYPEGKRARWKIRKVALGQEGNVFGRNRIRGQIEEGVFGLEVSKLQKAMQALDRPLLRSNCGSTRAPNQVSSWRRLSPSASRTSLTRLRFMPMPFSPK
jgi:hypothetical protein